MAISSEEFKPLAVALERDGWCVSEQVFEPAFIARLAAECRQLDATERLRHAGIGHGGTHTVNTRIRGDRTCWLDAEHSPLQTAFLARMDALRGALNQHLLLGMEGFEAHYALYPPGTFYARHRDCFRDDDARVLSSVLYLNPAWQDVDGGELRLFLPDGRHHDIPPAGGRLVMFLSAEFEHEVRPATRERLSIAGWFRRRPLNEQVPAP